MNLLINALVTPPSPVGVGNYIRELVLALNRYYPEANITLLVYSDTAKGLFAPNPPPEAVKLEVINCKYSPRIKGLLFAIFWLETKLNKLIESHNIDLYLTPNTSYLPKSTCPSITTIHDLLELDTSSSNMLSRLYRKFVLRQIKKHSSHILTVSQFSKSRILHYFDYKPEYVSAIAPLLKDALHHSTEYERKEPIIFCVTNSKTYKNAKLLINAYLDSKLPMSGWKLVLTGNLNDKLFLNTETNKYSGIVRTGYITEKELHTWYAKSAIYCSPSKYEGYDLPVAEANLYGCKLMLSDIPVHREIWGDKAIYFSPDTKKSLVEKLNSMIKEDLNTNSVTNYSDKPNKNRKEALTHKYMHLFEGIAKMKT